jgi:Icc-related predicted phosphoesterase
MKILCVSDQIDPLVYSSSIKRRFEDVDMVLSAGDLPLDYLEFIVSSLDKPLFFVFGNHNLNEFNYYRGMVNDRFGFSQMSDKIPGAGTVHIGGKVVKEGSLIIAGLGGSLRYNEGRNQFTDFQMYLEIMRLVPRLIFNKIKYGRYLDILLTHASPKGIHDRSDRCHQGFKAFLWFMKVFEPKYLIHGHIHLYDLSERRISEFLKTIVLNAYSHQIIEVSEDKERK